MKDRPHLVSTVSPGDARWHPLNDIDTVLEALPVGVFVARDAACRHITANSAGARMLGLPAGINLSKSGPDGGRLPFTVFRDGVEVPADMLPMQRAARERVLIAGEEIEILRGDGSRVTLYKYATPLFDEAGEVHGCLGLFVDVSDRKRAEEARRAAEELLHFITDGIPSLISYIDRDMRYRLNNRAYQKWFGRPAEACVGHHVRDVVGAAAWEKLRPYMERARDGEALSYEAEIPYASGGTRWISGSYAPHLDANGDVQGFAVLVNDISSRKEVERTLRESERQLREADRRKDEFLATLAHELRNPLAPLQNALHLLRMRPHDAGAVDQIRQVMERQLGHLVRLVDDLLDVSRVTRGMVELRTERVDLGEVLESALDTSRHALESAGHHFVYKPPRESILLEANPIRLAQVVANLLNNAAKYTERGGRIVLEAERRGDEAVITVRDSGIGIPPEMLGPSSTCSGRSTRHPNARGAGSASVSRSCSNWCRCTAGAWKREAPGQASGASSWCSCPSPSTRASVRDRTPARRSTPNRPLPAACA